MEISLWYKPRPWQKQVHADKSRWKVIVCHRRAGKTNMAIIELMRWALQTPNSRFAYVAPFYVQAKSITWDMLKKYSRPIPGITINESELRVDYPNWSRVSLYGADNPDRLRGIALWGVVFDEYAQQPSSIFSEIIRPALSDNKGWALWIGTPKGRNAFYELNDFAGKTEGWFQMTLKASESGVIDDEELADAKTTMTEDEYAQEYECSWEASIKGAYYSKEMQRCRDEWRMERNMYDPVLSVYTAWDLGISDYTSIAFFQIAAGSLRFIDYIQDNGRSLESYAKSLSDKPYRYETHYFPHDIEQRELTTGVSRLEMVRKMFNRPCSVLKMSRIMDGINEARVQFPKIWFDEDKTQELRNSLMNYTQEWDDKKGVFKDNPRHDWSSHGADAFRYAIQAYKVETSFSNNQLVSFEVDYSDFI